jgi:hypothetical protein
MDRSIVAELRYYRIVEHLRVRIGVIFCRAVCQDEENVTDYHVYFVEFVFYGQLQREGEALSIIRPLT